MDNIFQQIQQDLISSMKSGDIETREALRMLISEIQKVVVDQGLDRANIPDEIVIKAIEKSVKNRKDSIAIFEEQGRNDLVEPEKQQLEAIMKYMPAQLTDDELRSIVEKAKLENPTVQGMALMGKIIPLVKGKASADRIKGLL